MEGRWRPGWGWCLPVVAQLSYGPGRCVRGYMSLVLLLGVGGGLAEVTRGLRGLPGGRLRDSVQLSYQSGGGYSYTRASGRRAEGGETGGAAEARWRMAVLKRRRGGGGDVWKSSPMGEQRERGRRGKRRSQPE